MGHDGSATTHQSFARDAYSYTLNYFDGDYQSIDPTRNFEASKTGSEVADCTT
jgi:hypothetical protein